MKLPIYSVNKFSCVGAFLVIFVVRDARSLQSPTDLSEVSVMSQVKAAEVSGRWTEADHLVSMYLDKHPEATKMRFALAYVQLREDLPNNSLETYTQAAKEIPPSASDLYYVALDYVLLNDYTDADKWITRSVQMNGSDGEAWYSYGRIKYTENRFREAVEGFERAIALMPRSVKAENNLGLAYEGLNEPNAAIGAYRLALAWQQDSDHQSEQPYLNLGKLLTDRNELDEALVLLQKAKVIAPKNSKIRAALGKLHALRGEFPLAQNEFEEALRADPNDAALHFQLGQALKKQGLQDRAKNEFKRASELTGAQSSNPASDTAPRDRPSKE